MQPLRVIIELESRQDAEDQPPDVTRLRLLLKRLARQHGFRCLGYSDSLTCPAWTSAKLAKRRRKRATLARSPSLPERQNFPGESGFERGSK